MKVLEKGNWDNPWSMEYVCPEKSCGAKLLIEEKDVKPVDYSDRNYAECAICEEVIYIESKLLPQRVLKVLAKKRKYRDND